MEIEDYIQQKERRLRKSSRSIKDFRVFDFSHVPEKPLMREEVKPLADAILRYLKTGIPNHLLIVGSRGSGKTLLARYLGKRLAQSHGGQFLYVNCRHHNTSFKILAELLAVKPRGLALDELWTQFQAQYSAPLILALDEVDLLSEKDRRKDLLYLLSRSERNYMAILLSNNPHFHEQLDPSIRSTLQPEIIHFRNYNAEQVRAILEQRAQAGLRHSRYADIAQISGLTTRLTNSDIRIAIKTLYLFALEPSLGIEGNFERARRDIVVDLIRGLNDKNLIILKAASSVDEGYVKRVYARYRQISQAERETPFSYVYFYSNLAYLQSMGLILLVSTKIRRAYTNQIRLLFDSEAVEPIWAARFG